MAKNHWHSQHSTFKYSTATTEEVSKPLTPQNVPNLQLHHSVLLFDPQDTEDVFSWQHLEQ